MKESQVYLAQHDSPIAIANHQAKHLNPRVVIVSVMLISPLILFILPTAFGHPPIFGDNATQNEPLRWLVARDYLNGKVPGWDPYNWDGTPLLAGFNAGAFYPLIVWFLILPPVWATAVSLASSWLVAEIAIYFLLRHFNVSWPVALLGAVCFVDSGAYISQVVHLDMIEGDTASLLAILSLFKLLDADRTAKRLARATLLGVSFALVVLAGAPEAMLASLVFLGGVYVVRLIKHPKASIRFLPYLVFAAVLALALSGVQWVPGLAYAHISTRSHLPHNYAGVGPFSPIFFPLAVFPMAYGGYQGDYLPGYFGSYNPSEVTIAVGSVALLFATIALTAKGRRELTNRAELVLPMVIAFLFALGSTTPIAHIVYALPLFNLQRLASRYIIDFDIGLVLLAAAGAQIWINNEYRISKAAKTSVYAIVGASTAFAIMEAALTDRVLRVLQVANLPSMFEAWGIRVYLLIQLLVIGASAYLLVSQKIKSSHRIRWLVVLLLLDLANLAGQFIIAPSIHVQHDNQHGQALSSLLKPGQRYGLYDPNLFLYNQWIQLDEQPDRNVFTGLPSIQGYASLSLAGYNNLTRTKTQSTLDPRLVGLYKHMLQMDVLITSPHYFYTKPFPKPLLNARLPAHLRKLLPIASKSTEFYTGLLSRASAVKSNLGAKDHISLVSLKGKPVNAGPNSNFQSPIHDLVEIKITGPKLPKHPLIWIRGSRGWHLVAGQLTNFVLPEHWYPVRGQLGTINYVARRPVSGFVATAGVTVHQAIDGTIKVAVNKRTPTVTQSSFAYAPGWHATDGITISDNRGLIRLALPAGRYSAKLYYRVPFFRQALAVSAAGVILAIAILTISPFKRRYRPQHAKAN
jgi:hypothetical protein